MQPSLSILAFVAAIASAVDPVPEGGVCGGGTSNALICAENLDCTSNGGPGSTGICKRKVSDVGGPCAQFDFPYTAICKDGLVCNPPNVQAKGAAGTCLELQVSELGGVCEIDKSPLIVCGKGLVCVPASIPLIGPVPVGTPSTCQPTPKGAWANVGEICGGPTPNVNVCQPDLDCVVQSDVVGLNTGICSIKTSEAGGPCSTWNPDQSVLARGCRVGLTCVPPTQSAMDGFLVSYSGTCQFTPDSYVAVGGVCGGGNSTSPICASGLDCLSLERSGPTSQGICTSRIIDIDQPCQPFFQNGTACKVGSICVLPSNPTADDFGTCKAAAPVITTAASVVATMSAIRTTPAVVTTVRGAAILEGISVTLFGLVVIFIL
ncbi:hypothetical protein HDU79_000279 [Rhizoclosmatium sp. JEL0117]|nr:hypothetical protein HDU79_000279 [Rhizoclosmatium sp. JEL0117]